MGLVEDSTYRSPRDSMSPIAYFPMSQLADDEMRDFATLAVRSAGGSPAALTSSVATAVGQVDPNLSLTFRPFLGSGRRPPHARAPGLVALRVLPSAGASLAGIGLYGVLSFAITQGRTQIAVRMVLGAAASGVMRLVPGTAFRLAAPGSCSGTAAGLWAARFVSSLLFGLEAREGRHAPARGGDARRDPCLLAAGLPARRASRIDPAQVLREGLRGRLGPQVGTGSPARE